jgi:hypothetical protein
VLSLDRVKMGRSANAPAVLVVTTSVATVNKPTLYMVGVVKREVRIEDCARKGGAGAGGPAPRFY